MALTLPIREERHAAQHAQSSKRVSPTPLCASSKLDKFASPPPPNRGSAVLRAAVDCQVMSCAGRGEAVREPQPNDHGEQHIHRRPRHLRQRLANVLSVGYSWLASEMISKQMTEMSSGTLPASRSAARRRHHTLARIAVGGFPAINCWQPQSRCMCHHEKSDRDRNRGRSATLISEGFKTFTSRREALIATDKPDAAMPKIARCWMAMRALGSCRRPRSGMVDRRLINRHDWNLRTGKQRQIVRFKGRMTMTPSANAGADR